MKELSGEFEAESNNYKVGIANKLAEEQRMHEQCIRIQKWLSGNGIVLSIEESKSAWKYYSMEHLYIKWCNEDNFNEAALYYINDYLKTKNG